MKSTQAFIRDLAATMGTRPAAPDGTMAVEDAVQLAAEKVCGDHPDWTVGGVYQEVIRAITGRGPYADLWRTLRGREPAEKSA